MGLENQEEREPLKLKIILPLLGMILVCVLIFSLHNSSKFSIDQLSTVELTESFNAFVSDKSKNEPFRLFTSAKTVTWEQGPSLVGLLEGIKGQDAVSSISLKYQIPVYVTPGGDWVFSLGQGSLDIQAPSPTFGDAVLDPASLEISYKSELSSQEKEDLKELLKQNLSAYRVAIDKESRVLLESESRTRIQGLVEEWVSQSFDHPPALTYRVTFLGSETESADEP